MTDGLARSMPRVAIVGVAVAIFSLAAFAVASFLEVRVLADPASALDGHGATAALTGVSLLVADVVLPVPSSVVMIAHGALFGVTAGAALSLTGRVGAAAVAGAVGRAARRYTPARGTRRDTRAEELVRRWGPLAVVVTRPVPVLAESVAVAAGAAGMRWAALVAAATLGALPEAVVYAAAGAVGANSLPAIP